MHQTPHHQMTKLDQDGTPYRVNISIPGRDILNAPVISHSEKWIEVRSDQLPLWVNMAMVDMIRIIIE